MRPAVTIPDYELLRLIGRGAYGEVWLGRNLTGSTVAVKVVSRAAFEDDRPFERELEGIRRYEPVSRSDPGQVAILHVGRGEGFFYYVMELADDANQSCKTGGALGARRKHERTSGSVPAAHADWQTYVPHTLGENLRQYARLPVEDCVEIGLALSSALNHLHEHGLVHRDVKPSNIVFVKGVPKLADVGLVASVDATRSFVGTAGYLPPEGPGKPSGDLYSLGKVVYELCVGRDRQDFPSLPENWEAFADRKALLELNAIVLKACAHDPRERYQSGAEMRAELELLQRGKSVRRQRWMCRQWQVARRTALLAAAISVPLFALSNRAPRLMSASRPEKLSTNAQANFFYELGQSYFDKLRGTNFQQAADYFQQAIDLDPNFAQAYAAMAAVYSWSDGAWNPGWKGFPKARQFALQALRLDDTLAQPHEVLGCYHAMIEWNWADAEMELKLALRCARTPARSASCHLAYAEVLRIAGRANQALEEILAARALDPHSITIQRRLAGYLADARKFEEALEQIAQVKVVDPNLDMSWLQLYVLCALKNYSEAIKTEGVARVGRGEPKDKVDLELDGLKRAMEKVGPEAFWKRELQNADDDYDRGRAHVQLGEHKEAMACLQRSFNERSAWLTFRIMTDWAWDPLRSEPRFRDILKGMHLQ